MFKPKNKDIRATSMTLFWCLYCSYWTYFTAFASASVVYFEQVNVFLYNYYPASIGMFKINNRNNRGMCEILLKANDVILVSLLLTLNKFTHSSLVPTVNFEQLIVK